MKHQTSRDRRRAAAQANGAKGQGHHTPEGKRISSLNATKHGLTARTILLPGDDHVAFHTLKSRMYKEMTPKTTEEEFLLQCLFEYTWVLGRAGCDQINLFALGAVDHADEVDCADPQIRLAMSGVRTQIERTDMLEKMTRYQVRLKNLYYRAMKELKELQYWRRPQETSDAEQAAKAAAEKTAKEAAAAREAADLAAIALREEALREEAAAREAAANPKPSNYIRPISFVSPKPPATTEFNPEKEPPKVA